ncbi:MAG: hypothetical protein AAF928_04960 [Myxococcota bacterium]
MPSTLASFPPSRREVSMAHPDYEAFLASFNDHGVRYLVVGAHALALHARPRATKDLDIVIATSMANGKRVVAAVRAFFGGTPPRYVTVDELQNEDSIVQLGVAPVRIDLISGLATTTFTRAYNRRVQSPFGQVVASFISAPDLRAEKEHWSRPQDLADLASLDQALRRKP